MTHTTTARTSPSQDLADLEKWPARPHSMIMTRGKCMFAMTAGSQTRDVGAPAEEQNEIRYDPG